MTNAPFYTIWKMKPNEVPGGKAAEKNAEEELGILEKNVDVMLALDMKSERQRGASHKVIDLVGQSFETPAFFVLIALVVGGWISVNIWGNRVGIATFDAPPFSWLQGVISLASLVTTAVVLVKQSGIARLDRRRDRVELQLIILTEQKVAKSIALIEELRRDLPTVGNRHDPQAEVLGKTMHPQKVLDTIDRSLGDKN
jgi:uncharacterized membrane protein